LIITFIVITLPLSVHAGTKNKLTIFHAGILTVPLQKLKKILKQNILIFMYKEKLMEVPKWRV